MTTTRYLTVAETAKLVRKQLKAQFPGQKFSVRSDSYSGGASIRISWTDGPLDRKVDEVVQQFSGASFDGMIDLKTHFTSWLNADGTAGVAYDGGTQGSRGVYESRIGAPQEGSELVHFGADFIFTEREVTAELAATFEGLVRPCGNMSQPCNACGNYVRDNGFIVEAVARHGSVATFAACSVEHGGVIAARQGIAIEEVNA